MLLSKQPLTKKADPFD